MPRFSKTMFFQEQKMIGHETMSFVTISCAVVTVAHHHPSPFSKPIISFAALSGATSLPKACRKSS